MNRSTMTIYLIGGPFDGGFYEVDPDAVSDGYAIFDMPRGRPHLYKHQSEGRYHYIGVMSRV